MADPFPKQPWISDRQKVEKFFKIPRRFAVKPIVPSSHQMIEIRLQSRSPVPGTDHRQVAGDFSKQPREFGRFFVPQVGFYVRNNVGIALRCFAVGIFFGALTVYVLLSNGIAIGAIGGYIVSQGHGEAFTSFVISHGSFELTAIAVAGGAGLMLGHALIHPGQRTRLESLRTMGSEAVQIAAGAAAMLVIAAVIEAFWSPSGVPSIWKYIAGTGLWLLVILYLALAGRGK